jgi:hypothetical protein
VLLRPAIPDWVLLVKPHGTDESGCLSSILFAPYFPGGSDTFLGQSGELRVELDAQPVTSVLLGHHSDGAGAEERVEDQPGLPIGVTLACGLQDASGMAVVDLVRPLPGLPTGPTDPLWTGGQKRP